MKNIVITGGSGQLGGDLRRIFPEGNYPTSAELDLSSPDSIVNYFKNMSPDLIINCGAYTQVDKAETEKERASLINEIAPGILASLCTNFIQISTDYVFNGKFQSPITETEFVDPINFYGESKLKGEENAIKINPRTVIIRTSWVYSDLGNNFVKTMIRLGRERESLRVVADQMGTPTSAFDLAKLIYENGIVSFKFNPGIYNYSNEGATSWYEFAAEIMKITGINCEVMPIKSEEYPTPAKRPLYSVLDKSKIKKELGINIPNWKESLKSCIQKLS